MDVILSSKATTKHMKGGVGQMQDTINKLRHQRVNLPSNQPQVQQAKSHGSQSQQRHVGSLTKQQYQLPLHQQAGIKFKTNSCQASTELILAVNANDTKHKHDFNSPTSRFPWTV